MLDLKKIDKEMTKSIQSYTREQLLEWVDSYNKRIAEAELEKKNTAHVNGTVINGTASRKVTQPRAVNGRFVSKQAVVNY